MKILSSLDDLNMIYGQPAGLSLWKELDYIHDHYRRYIEKSPFLILATCGDNGVDCSPRGDPPGFVRVVDDKTLYIPDRRGNNRLDSLKNIITNPNVSLMFLIPGVGEVIRVRGKASIIVDEEINLSFAVNDKPATSVLSIHVDSIYFQCPKSIFRSKLWSSELEIDKEGIASCVEMSKTFAKLNNEEFDAENRYKGSYEDYMKRNSY